MSERMKVLVVDDDPDILGLVGSILAVHGFDVATAPGGQAALRLLREGPAPCLILIDLEMPGMSGLELRAELARNPSTRNIPVAMTSVSRESLGRIHASLRRLEKPFVLEELVKAVEDHCSPSPGAGTGAARGPATRPLG